MPRTCPEIIIRTVTNLICISARSVVVVVAEEVRVSHYVYTSQLIRISNTRIYETG